MNTRALKIIGLATLGVLATSITAYAQGTCGFRGGRGYENPRGSECRAQYNIYATRNNDGVLSFRSDGRTWFFQCYAATGECEFRYTSPPTRTAVNGALVSDANDNIQGWFHSNHCGRGWISLNLEGCN
ncbi:MAG: hypothetical protein GC150_13020 [Rhizobiales bacterium]|nr:hypothetical protein [Hyphomicrobiales bacterium]